MKTLIFSDTHLTTLFDQKLFDALKLKIQSVDLVIINGDFWDGFAISFDEFINSRWNQLFQILIDKNAVYIYGNHDLKEFCDDRVNLFSEKQTYFFSLQLGKVTYTITHGHQYFGDFAERYPFLKKIFGFSYKFLIYGEKKTPRLFHDQYVEHIMRHNQKNHNHMIDALERKYDGISEVVILGHTHMADDKRKNGYIVLGPFYRFQQNYAIIDDQEIIIYSEYA